MEEIVKKEPIEEPKEEEAPEKPQKFRRQNYTLEFKTQVVEFAEKTNNCQASTLFGVPRQCIQNWRRVKEDFLNAKEPFGKPKKQMKRLKGGGRKLKNAEMDQKMEKWLKEKEEMGEKITGTMIKEYAISISDDSEFRASNGWLQRFLVRHKLNLGSSKKEKPSIPDSMVSGSEFSLEDVLRGILNSQNPEDVDSEDTPGGSGDFLSQILAAGNSNFEESQNSGEINAEQLLQQFLAGSSGEVKEEVKEEDID
ncbi:hypothetical protein B9Z55_015487 [Caenorhabditis nigoni]|uniref:HTH CENPB-type domain-containing protein n=1 Tax=Caenorhabditis nigoni TaxID=1611254 RepID=A0A2G5UAI4_9PELO|nr:hypothetical protein B9Z55_015487 [Caenorhabditis nigoni]